MLIDGRKATTAPANSTFVEVVAMDSPGAPTTKWRSVEAIDAPKRSLGSGSSQTPVLSWAT
ncbi:hypothetical protein, partial [Streptomyces pristinaespiralis]|uniref:hypothetical protein n=1 Tax=Streptomyces pristinaespiralis TaxID=38300 RepID=UPI000564ADC6